MAKSAQNKIKKYQDEIDLIRLGKALWHKAWIILVAGILCAVLAFLYVTIFVTPQYSASVMLYVNSKSLSIGGGTSVSISAQDITASRNLVDTYIVILKNRTTMEQIIERTGVKYNYKQLLGMISAKTESNTEVFSVTVTSPDPEEAALLANAIAQVLPIRVSEVIDGTSVRVVDGAEINRNKVSPSITRYTAIGLLIGVVIACAVIVVQEIMDTTIHEDDDIFELLDVPVLTKIPNLHSKESGKYYYKHGYAAKASTYGKVDKHTDYYQGKNNQD